MNRREALANNLSFNLANHLDGVHSFDNQNDDERSRQIIRSAIEFLKITSRNASDSHKISK